MKIYSLGVFSNIELAIIYFRMACLEDPPLSFSAAIALPRRSSQTQKEACSQTKESCKTKGS
jgi:hypothetical protein